MNLKSKLFKKRSTSLRILYKDHNAAEQLGKELSPLLPSSKKIVIVCVGSDRSTGDSLGPLVGSKLKNKTLSHFHVYGTLDEPIHAVNLEEQLHDINKKHRNPFIIGIDACLGRVQSIGMISLNDGPLKPGAGVNKQLPPVGEVHIAGIVNVSGFMEYLVLQNTRLSLVMSMAQVIADGIYMAEKLKQNEKYQRLSTLKWGLK